MAPERIASALRDRYRIERELGMGGMATVYLAADLKHDRKVAIKVLKPELAAVLGAERFVQEIKTTAALSHPHILPLFDSGEADGFLYYVMPYIEGETIREKLNRETQFGIDEAVRIATEVADALDYAHRHGVIHRDIKPENILLHDGRAMVMDFGIALAVSAAAGGRMTETGLSLGTPHYMSPEQATADKAITARSDVYSLASVLYEALSGEPPHTGGSAQQIIMKIIAEPVAPVTTRRPSAPPNVSAALITALQKLPADRFASAARFSDALRDPHYGAALAHGDGVSPLHQKDRWNRLTIVMTSLAAAMTLVAGWAIASRPAPHAPPVTRTTVELPLQVQLGSASIGSRVAISRDGSEIVFVGWEVGPGTLRRQLFSRRRDRLEIVPIPGTEDSHSPFFSPDGRRIGFVTVDPPAVKWVPIEGGSPIVATDSLDLLLGRAGSGGAVWGPGGVIYTRSLEGVIRVPENGGSPTLVSHNDSTKSEKGHTPTDVLPNGRGLIVTVNHTPNTMLSLYDIAAVDLKTGKHRILVRGVYGRYLAPGYLVFLRADGTLAVAPFDQDRMELNGPAVTITPATDVGNRIQDIALSDDGTLIHVNQAAPSDSSEIVWVTRNGTVTSYDSSWHAAFESVSLSPDGKRLAAGILTKQGAEVWIAQLPAGPRARLTTVGTINYRPTWLPDNQRVAYRSVNPGTNRFELVAKRADGLGPTERLAGTDRSIATGFVSHDGAWRIYRTDATERGRGDIYALRAGDSIPTALVATEAEERFPSLSPNGRWLAYRSNAGGVHDVWVRPFPNVNDGRWQVSVAGGTEPVWSHSGRELFYLTPSNELMAATITTDPTFAVRQRRVLFARPPSMALNIATTTYDISADDERFLMIRVTRSARPGEKVDDKSGGRLVLVENWVEELKARVPR